MGIDIAAEDEYTEGRQGNPHCGYPPLGDRLIFSVTAKLPRKQVGLLCYEKRCTGIYPGDASFYGMDGQNSGGRQLEIQVNGCDLPGYQQ